MNVICLVGRMTKDIELRRTQEGKACCTFTLAVDRMQKGVVDFIDCVIYGQGAEYLSKFAGKGCKTSVQGSLQSRKWQDRNGNNRLNWEVMVQNVHLESFKDGKKDPAEDYLEIEDPDNQLPF